jgi:hypothetical protein
MMIDLFVVTLVVALLINSKCTKVLDLLVHTLCWCVFFVRCGNKNTVSNKFCLVCLGVIFDVMAVCLLGGILVAYRGVLRYDMNKSTDYFEPFPQNDHSSTCSQSVLCTDWYVSSHINAIPSKQNTKTKILNLCSLYAFFTVYYL